MKTSALKYTMLLWVSRLSMLIILLLPFHAFLTVWGSSLIGHYTALRLWKEVLLLLCVASLPFLMAIDHKIRDHTLTRQLVRIILLYIVINALWGVIAYHYHSVSAKALGYGLIVNLRFPIFFLITWAAALRLKRLRENWQKLLLWPAAVVILFGLLQIFILPHNFLSHFGYGSHTIPAYETINHNSHYIRIMSTLRGANPLGAYLLVPLSALAIGLIVKRRWQTSLLFAAGLVVLFFSFSRSAWLGMALSLLTIVLLHEKLKPWRSKILVSLAAAVIILIGLLVIFRHNSHVQNYILHTQSHSTVQTNSDAQHASALSAGLHDLIHQPLGHGPGTSGPASIYNNHPARQPENYFIQVGEETGWLGFGLFILINFGVGYLLWLRRSEPLALALFASLLGLTLINLFLPAWTDDTLAYVWWGLAGVALAPTS